MKLLYLLSILLLLQSCSKNKLSGKFDSFGISNVSWQNIQEIDGISTSLAYKLHIDNNNVLWVATYGNGLIKIGDNAIKFTTENSSIPSDTIYSIDSDSHGNIWGGTSNGLFKLSGNDFTTYDSSNSPVFWYSVRAIGIDNMDNVWFQSGHATEGGLGKYNPQNEEWSLITPENSSLPTRIINDIYFTDEGDMYIGHGIFQGKGGIWHKTPSGTEETFTINNSNLKFNYISDIAEDVDGDLWVASDDPFFLNGTTLFGGLQEFTDGNFETHDPTDSGNSSNRVSCIAIDKKGNIWVAAKRDDGKIFSFKDELLIFNGDEWLTLTKEIKDFPNIATTDIIIDDNVFWIATANGIIRMELDYK